MTNNPSIHHRHSIRLKEYDYWLTPIFNSQAGIYFVGAFTRITERFYLYHQ